MNDPVTSARGIARAYQNPVWTGYFADPFILHWRDAYYAFGTGEGLAPSRFGEPRAFSVLRSPDLVTWDPLDGALVIPEKLRHHAFRAPEVAERDGVFYLYYSSAPPSHDEQHRLRVATAGAPAGPFLDAGPVLPDSVGLTIDAHPFRDPRDGRWYLFFGRDFFDARTGTGLAVVPLRDDLLAGASEALTVVRANADWQIYERNRRHYGRDWPAWHTVEGPCVVMHDDRYYCFYSGGNWQTGDYGVSYAVADHPLGPWSHTVDTGPVVLREMPGEVLGPGHASHIVTTGGVELLVYHAWDAARTRRTMRLDRLVWTKDGPRCTGPSTTGQALT